MLLHEMMKDLKPLLKEGFPEHWEEICALAMVGVSGIVPLKGAEDAWEKLYNADEIHPSLNQKNLTRMLPEVGVNRAGQNILFKKLADLSKQLVYDLSSVFSRSMSINQAVKDIKTLYHSINELDIEWKVLILDRGFFSDGMKKAGGILIVSDMAVEKQGIYLLLKKREVVEKMFETYKTVLNTDKLYLQNDESVFGHVFLAFLSLYILCKLEPHLKNAKTWARHDHGGSKECDGPG